MADAVSLLSLVSSPTTLAAFILFMWKAYPRLLRIETAAKRANHNSTILVKAALRRGELTESEVKDLDLDDEI